jgi:hypothetical protein
MRHDEAALAAMHNTVGKGGRRIRSLSQRIQAKYFVDPSGCWTWTGAKGATGYGVVTVNADVGAIVAHRAVYLLHRGPIPPGRELDHLCRNRSCVNPEHLEPVTHAENGRRGLKGDLRPPVYECPAGHDYAITGIMNGQGYRICRECKAERQRRRRAVLPPSPSRRSLTEDQVRGIRAARAAGRSLTEVAAEFGTNRGTAYRVAERLSYADVP